MDISSVGENGAGGAPGTAPSGDGGAGGAGVDATDSSAAPGDPSNTADARGGEGGQGGQGGDGPTNPSNMFTGPGGVGGAGGAGGDGTASATTGLTSAAETNAGAQAWGGGGGDGAFGGNGTSSMPGGVGGRGGDATASAIDHNAGGSARARAVATGGDGGSNALGQAPGAAGVATATAIAVSTAAQADANALVQQQGGAGGNAFSSADARGGASSSATDAVSGSTNGGDLTLTQLVIGGAGGSSHGLYASGAGGAATSFLTLDDTQNATHSATITARSTATGGAGGVNFAGVQGQGGGPADASADVTGFGAADVSVTAQAQGGTAEGSGVNATGGAASATAVGRSGGAVDVTANAFGGSGDQAAGPALANATASGVSSSLAAMATTGFVTGTHLIWTLMAQADAQVDGTSVGVASAALGGALGAYVTAPQSVALATALPDAGSVFQAFKADTALLTTFGTAPIMLEMGEIGSGHSVGGTHLRTTTSDVQLTFDVTQLAVHHDLMLELFNPTVLGEGVSSVVLNVTIGSASVLHQVFGSAAAAQSYFTDHAIDLGSTVVAPGLGGMISVIDITLQVTASSGGSGFYANFAIGESTTGRPILGTADSDVLSGSPDSDLIQGLGGSDRIVASGGVDWLDGGNGSDVAVFSGLARSYALDLSAAAGTVTGGPEGGTDTLTSVENIGFADGVLTFDQNNAAAVVMRMYDTALHRLPDTLGGQYWTHTYESGQISLTNLAQAFANSTEFQNDVAGMSNRQIVDFMYENTLHRAPDQGGEDAWTAFLDAGHGLGELVLQFSESDEHKALTAPVVAAGLWDGDAAYQTTEFMYEATFGRLPDAGGLVTWANALKGGLSLHDMAVDFTSSGEFFNNTQGMSHRELVDYLYETALHRAPDPVGETSWTIYLDNGGSPADLVLQFEQSAELQLGNAGHIDHGAVFS